MEHDEQEDVSEALADLGIFGKIPIVVECDPYSFADPVPLEE
jgi:hypothetical protein